MSTSLATAVSTKKPLKKPRPHKRQTSNGINGQSNGKTLHKKSAPVEQESVPQEPAHPVYELPRLPTFTIETGYREVYNAQTGETEVHLLTLLDLLYPSEDDVGVVKMAQSPWHDRWSRWLATMLQAYFAMNEWLILHDVLVHWGRGVAPAKGPDVTVVQGGRFPADRAKSYRVGRDGPLPQFVVEITSEETRETDFHTKKLHYAAVGIKEYLLIDLLPDDGGDWQLYGFRLEDGPLYKELTADVEGGFTFETVGLRFIAKGRERIEVYNSATGERLLNPVEIKEHADSEAKRADSQTKRADSEAARAEKLAAQLRTLGIDPAV